MKAGSRLLGGVGVLGLLLGGIWSHAGDAYVEGNVIVTFKEQVALDAAKKVVGAHSLQLARHYELLSRLSHRHMFLLRAPPGRTTAAVIAELSKDPAVEVAEPDYLRPVTGGQPPNDPKFGLLWGLQNTGQEVNGLNGTAGDDIKAIGAWNLSRPQATPAVVGVIDTGVDYTHPDLVGSMWTNPGEIPNNGMDDDGNGFVDDYYGYDFLDDTPNPADSGFHGTHVSGTVAATGNNALGVIGVAYGAKIMALRASNDGSNIVTSAEIAAIQYATMMKGRGVNIVALNASFGGASSSSSERSAILAAGSAGIAFCAAAGNNTNNNDVSTFYPASYRLSNMLVVAATDQNDNLAQFSNYGATTVDLGAPGVNILSTTPVSMPGTSSYVQRGATNYVGNTFQFAGNTTLTGITASLYDCGLGYPSNFPTAVRSNIALISRGTLFFTDKVSNSITAGALAAVIYNNATGNFSGTLQYPNNWIPAVSLSQADGHALLSALPTIATVVSAVDTNMIYQLLDGTSMATPHVAGAIALAAMNFPSETVTQRVLRIKNNVDVKTNLSGKVASGGRLNLQRTVDADSNGLPDWWELQWFGHLTGTDQYGDPDKDGFNNLQEYIADTNPTNSSSNLRILTAKVATNKVNVTWTGGTQARQYVQRATRLGGTNTWTTVLTNQPPTAVTNVYLESVGTNTGAFYRIKAERP